MQLNEITHGVLMKTKQQYVDSKRSGFHFGKEFGNKIKFKGYEIKNRKDIIKQSNKSQVRFSDAVEKRASTLYSSFVKNVDFNEEPPALFVRPNNKYEYGDGFGREAMFAKAEARGELLTDSWIYGVYEVPRDLEIDVSLAMNNPLPRTNSSDNDVLEAAILKVTRGELNKTHKDFESFIKKTCPGFTSGRVTKLVNNLKDRYTSSLPVYHQSVTGYSSETLMTDWVKNHWSDADKYDFQLNLSGRGQQAVLSKNTDRYTDVITSNIYWRRKITSALHRFAETGKPTDFIMLEPGKVSSVKKLQQARMNTLDCIANHITNLEKLSKQTDKSLTDFRKFFRILGFVPQNNSKKNPEDIKRLVSVMEVNPAYGFEYSEFVL